MAVGRPRGTRREQSTEETRRLVLDAALQEFRRSGYGGTTAADIAATAGVSVATVYTSVGTKAVLLETLVRDGVQNSEAEHTVQAATAATSGRAVLQAVAHGTRTTNEAYEAVVQLLLDNPRAEPGFTALVQDVQAEYRRALDACAARLEELGALRPGTTVDQAGATLWLLFGLHAWLGLVVDLGWDYDTAESWLLSAAGRSLLRDVP